jgi:hypothetical protein
MTIEDVNLHFPDAYMDDELLSKTYPIELCPARFEELWCTRTMAHEGPHVARGAKDVVYCVWGYDGVEIAVEGILPQRFYGRSKT